MSWSVGIMNFPIYGKTSKPLTRWLRTEAQFGICKSPFLLNCATGSTSEIIPSPVMNQHPPETKRFIRWDLHTAPYYGGMGLSH
jgi:hypothetical protein